MNTSAELYKTYSETKKLIADYPDMQAAFTDVENLFDDKNTSAALSIMIYGIYNAGKSSLINALIGSEVAPIGDVPLTAEVKAYQWNGFSILDTPGVDAPLEHEQITKNQMMLADAIVFVVNPSGAAEEEKTLGKLIELIHERKKVFLVFNEKNTLSQEDFIRLKNDIRKRLQSLAIDNGLNEVLADIPILRVNAATALKGKLAMKQGLVEHSGISELEASLDSFFTSITPEDVNSRLSHALLVYLNQFIEQFATTDSSDLVNRYTELCSNLVVNQSQCRDNIQQEIALNRKLVTKKSRAAIYASPENSLTEIERIYTASGQAVVSLIEKELQYLTSQLDHDMEPIVAILEAQYDEPIVNTVKGQFASESIEVETKGDLNKEFLADAASSALKVAKPEHIVSGLKVVKDLVPSLMKGIGPKTMEKWAGQVVSKWIPYAGTVVTVLTALFDLFSEDSSDKKMREQEASIRQQRERFEQQVEDSANDLGEQFERAMNQVLRTDIEPVFQKMLDELESALESANEKERVDRSTVMKAQALSASIR